MEAARIIPAELADVVRVGWVPEVARPLALPTEIEEIVGGGLPRGRLCEVVGVSGSGRTSLVYALLAATTAAAEVAAVVDAPGAFDPSSAARAAIDLGAVLWVRPPSARDAFRCAELILSAGGFGLVVLDLDGVPLRRLRLSTWPRLARAAEKANAALVVLAPERLAGSFAVASVKMTPARRIWSRVGNGPSLFDGIESYGVLAHNKRGPVRATRRVRWVMASDGTDGTNRTDGNNRTDAPTNQQPVTSNQ